MKNAFCLFIYVFGSNEVGRLGRIWSGRAIIKWDDGVNGKCSSRPFPANGLYVMKWEPYTNEGGGGVK